MPELSYRFFKAAYDPALRNSGSPETKATANKLLGVRDSFRIVQAVVFRRMQLASAGEPKNKCRRCQKSFLSER